MARSEAPAAGPAHRRPRASEEVGDDRRGTRHRRRGYLPDPAGLRLRAGSADRLLHRHAQSQFRAEPVAITPTTGVGHSYGRRGCLDRHSGRLEFQWRSGSEAMGAGHALCRWDGACSDGRGLRPPAALPKDGALFTLQEYGAVDEPYTFSPRPDQFVLGPLLGPFECFGVKAHEIEFQDGGRFIQVFAMFGADAPASLRQEVEQSLDSLQVNPLPPSAQPTADCGRGRWTSCPEAAWVYQVINRAHVVHLGHRGVQAILGVVGKRSFALWTTSSGQDVPSGQCRVVAGAKVCQVGTRLVWRAQGLLLWVEPAPSPYSSLRTTPALPAEAVLERLVRASESVGLVRS